MKSGLGIWVAAVCAGWSLRADEVLTLGWRFAKETDRNLSAEKIDFDDSAWREVRVPHDWAISGPFDPKGNGGTGKLPWQGVGWYRKTLELAASDAGKCVYLDFDGVMASPQVYVNGQLAGGWDYGYMSFRVDATPYVKFGEKNVIAVRVSTLDHRSRWYPGAGIYRKVVLRIQNSSHFAYHGIQITTPEVEKDRATVTVKWEIEQAPLDAAVAVKLMRKGIVAAESSAFASAGSLNLTVGTPALWDVESPNLYTAAVALKSAAGETLAEERIRFGIRTIAFPVATGPLANDWAANGFHLNGRRVQMRGVNLHSDLGLLGMAFDRSAMRRQLSIMKAMGVNALRTSHNAPAPEVLDLCDEMGILVWDECFDKWDGTAGRKSNEKLEPYVARNLQAFVKRDRNHPSVVVWSMSNEIGKGKPDDPKNNGLTRARCALFREKMRELDTTRPIGNGNIYFMSYKDVLDDGIYDDLDITGWNYGGCYRPVKEKYPTKPLVYSESASAYSSYGFYINPPPTGKRELRNNQYQVDSYDHNAGPDIPDVEFDRMEKDCYVCGEFVWTGFDYLGEPSPHPDSRSAYYGIVDLTGVPKDRYYLYRSYWNPQADTLHILPHWNWAGLEGKSVPVYVYTSGDSAELFLNGRSLGIRKKDGQSLPGFTNLMTKAAVTASSVEDDKGNFAKLAIDGDSATRWCAATRHLPEWIQFDLGEPKTFRYLAIEFEFEYALYAFEAQVSADGERWETVFAKKAGETKPIALEKPVTARYVKVPGTEVQKGYFASIRDVYASPDPIPTLSQPYYRICDKYRLRWLDVPYEPGELKVIAYKDGKRLGEKTMRTAGEPAALKLTVEPKYSDDEDELIWVQIDALDAKGVRNPLAMNRLQFKLEGNGTILGVGNGNPHAFEAFTETASHPLFYGKAMAVIRRDAPGPLSLTVSSEGLTAATVTLP